MEELDPIEQPERVREEFHDTVERLRGQARKIRDMMKRTDRKETRREIDIGD